MKAYVEYDERVLYPEVSVEGPNATILLKHKIKARVEGIPLGETDSLPLVAHVEKWIEDEARQKQRALFEASLTNG